MMNFKMIEKPLVMLFLLCLLPLGASAQSIVKGIVTDPRRALKKSPFLRTKTENAYDL